MDKAQIIKELREKIATLEQGCANREPQALRSLGAKALDAALPWGGLPAGGLHEVVGPAAEGFVAALLSCLCYESEATVFWLRADDQAYGPGLAGMGLSHDRLLVLRHGREKEVLWALEECLRSGLPCVVAADLANVSPMIGRRLQLASETGRAPTVLRRLGRTPARVASALTRWRADFAPAGGDWQARWRVTLERCRGGGKHDGRSWHLEWNDETHHFTVVSELSDGSAEALSR